MIEEIKYKNGWGHRLFPHGSWLPAVVRAPGDAGRKGRWQSSSTAPLSEGTVLVQNNSFSPDYLAFPVGHATVGNGSGGSWNKKVCSPLARGQATMISDLYILLWTTFFLALPKMPPGILSGSGWYSYWAFQKPYLLYTHSHCTHLETKMQKFPKEFLRNVKELFSKDTW